MSPLALVTRVWRTDRVARFSAIGCLLAVALAAAVLVLLAAVPAALQDRAERTSWRGPDASPLVSEGRDPILPASDAPALAAPIDIRLGDRTLQRVDLATDGGDRPADGMPRIPRAGETLVSPAVARALDGPDAALVRAAVPGKVVGTLGPAALAGPDEWVIAAGRPRAALAGTDAVGLASVANVGGVVAQPFLVVLCWIALAIVAFPAAALAAQVARLQAGRRAGRLAALRLAGADADWVVRAAALETTVVAVLGALLGAIGGALATRALTGVAVDGTTWWAGSLTPPAWAPIAAVLLLPAIVAVSTVASVLPAAREPFAAVRSAPQRAPRHWRVALIPVTLVAGWYALGHVGTGGGSAPLVAVLAFGVLATTLVGTWTVHVLGRGFGARWRRPPLLLASRRMRAQPGAVWRTASGPVLAAFAAATVLAMLPAISTDGPEAERRDLVGANVPAKTAPAVAAAVGDRLAASPAGTAQGGAGGATPGTAQSGASGLADRVRVAGPQRSQGLAAQLGGVSESTRRMVVVGVRTAAERDRATAALTAAAAGVPVLGSDQPTGYPDVTPAMGLGAAVTLLLTALLAAVATGLAAVGGVLDRRRALGALRLAGAPLGALDRALRAEVALPTTLGTLGAAACGLGLAQVVLAMADQVIAPAAWPGIAAAVAAAAALPWLATWLVRPVLARFTGLDAVRG